MPVNILIPGLFFGNSAILNSSGEFSPSTSKVGIDPPLSSSYQLERSAVRIAEIEAEVNQFEIELDNAYQRYLNKKAASSNGYLDYRLGVILVDFTPSERWTNDDNEDGYPKTAFDSLFFSRNYWIGDKFNTPHPDEELLFGSFADYYDDQSQGIMKFEGKDGLRQIINIITS